MSSQCPTAIFGLTAGTGKCNGPRFEQNASLTNSLVNFKFITAYTKNDQGSVKSHKPIHTGEGPAYAGRYA